MNPFDEQDHRPWPLPKRPWIMVQIWRDLLFTHWSLPPASIEHLVPEPLLLDTFDGQAWISITPFHMSLRFRGLPPLSGMSDFPELNCRTYVSAEAKPGIYFFSLDAARRTVVWGARTFYHLPYFKAIMRVAKNDDSFSYASSRGAARWSATCTPDSELHRARRGSLEYFLAERYCLYTVWKGKTYRGDIHHVPWRLQNASVSIQENTVAEAAGLQLVEPPRAVSFSREIKVLIWALERIR